MTGDWGRVRRNGRAVGRGNETSDMVLSRYRSDGRPPWYLVNTQIMFCQGHPDHGTL